MSFVEWVWNKQDALEERVRRLSRGKLGRVMRLAKKPSYDEFTKTSWTVAIGIVITGGIGFTIYYFWLHAPPFLRGLFGV